VGLSGVLASDGGDRHRDASIFSTQAVDTATERATAVRIINRF
jgi:hypothetical protein